MALRQIGLMSPNIELSNLGCLISFVVDANSREVIIIRLRIIIISITKRYPFNEFDFIINSSNGPLVRLEYVIVFSMKANRLKSSNDWA